jgi:hypothetical protein
MAGPRHLLRVLGARLAVRRPSQPRDRRDHAPAGHAGRPRAAEALAQERPRPRDPRLHERAGARIRGSATTRSIRSSRRRRCRSWSARASRRARRRGRIWAWPRRAGRGLRLSRRGRWSPSAALRARYWGSSIRTTTSAGSSRRRTERSPPWAARRASRSRLACRSRATTRR